MAASSNDSLSHWTTILTPATHSPRHPSDQPRANELTHPLTRGNLDEMSHTYFRLESFLTVSVAGNPPSTAIDNFGEWRGCQPIGKFTQYR